MFWHVKADTHKQSCTHWLNVLSMRSVLLIMTMHSSSWNKPSFRERLSSSTPRMYRPRALTGEWARRGRIKTCFYHWVTLSVFPKRLTCRMVYPTESIHMFHLDTAMSDILYLLTVSLCPIVHFHQCLYDPHLPDKSQPGSTMVALVNNNTERWSNRQHNI